MFIVVAIVPADANVYLNVNVAASATVNVAASAALRRYFGVRGFGRAA
jgi:hypothetical protein